MSDLPRDPDEDLMPEPIRRALDEGQAMTLSGIDPETGEWVTYPFDDANQPGAWAAIARAREDGT